MAQSNPMKTKEDFETNRIQGDLSDKIFHDKIIQDYIKEQNGLLFGYLGHGLRNSMTDQILQEIAKQGHWSSKALAKWIISPNARHIMDQLPINKEPVREYLVKELHIQTPKRMRA